MENPRLKPELCWTKLEGMEFVGGEIDKKGSDIQTKIEADDEGYTVEDAEAFTSDYETIIFPRIGRSLKILRANLVCSAS